MRILTVCRDLLETDRSDDLKSVWLDHELRMISLADFSPESLADADCVVLAGSYAADTDVPLEPLSALTTLMADPQLPVLGIAWGFQIVCLAYGDDLTEVADMAEGAIRLESTSKGESLFQGSDPIRLQEGQRWNYDELPRGLVALARSETGVEALQHKTRPLLALQQYPADFLYGSDGKLVYQNLAGLLAKLATD